MKEKFNIIEDDESDGLQIYERELSVTQQVNNKGLFSKVTIPAPNFYCFAKKLKKFETDLN